MRSAKARLPVSDRGPARKKVGEILGGYSPARPDTRFGCFTRASAAYREAAEGCDPPTAVPAIGGIDKLWTIDEPWG
ncbi:hypothetical protein [Streptosporangium sp. 'caverna']|uniref:hypothetical protein n=1 Tax=Streptosporangium sp. 'caverna' TaxID=2202249 RepID=UPI000D7DD1ED|nr:hypothetical protein [Streptosporangium sp. 'caverna']AWS39990.1 hypothetical protein DKM19_00265 [Streptosporangium sp. 'caverna']